MTEAEILKRVRPRHKSQADALAWYRSSPLPGFS